MHADRLTPAEPAIEAALALARDRYAALDVDVDAALRRLRGIPLSLHCWQGDDVAGFEDSGESLGGGLAVTGQYAGRARSPDELRADLEAALAAIPGRHRVNLHAMYAETNGRRVERNEIGVEHFARWIEWADQNGLGMDFNPTFFAHAKASEGFTLSHLDAGVRKFWIEHGIASRKIGAAIGRRLGTPCVTNVWIPDGFKDTPVDRKGPRERLVASLDEMFAEPLDPQCNIDAVESKLFGIGSESYVAGSHEFYLGYAASRRKALCLDAGHFHPTESVADKISAIMLWTPMLLLHLSRGVRWDSDHVVTYTDELAAILQELTRGEFLDRTRIGLDYFDASVNRVAAWIIGARNALKALLAALVEPTARLRELERNGDFTGRLALQEEIKTLPLGAVWDYHCLAMGTVPGYAWLETIRQYERDVLSMR